MDTTKTRPGYLRRNAAAKHLGVSVRTLGELQRRHCVPFFRLSKRCILFKAADLEQCLDRFRIAAIGEGGKA